MTDTIPPILFRWNGETMEPMSKVWLNRATERYVIGEVYRLEAIAERSVASHNHYFATIHDLWLTLPEHEAIRFPTEEHLRKYALISTGYRDERSIVCTSKAEAQRFAAFIKPYDDFAVVSVKEAVVRVWTAKSQSLKAMGKKEFQRSKEDVLQFIDSLLGVKA